MPFVYIQVLSVALSYCTFFCILTGILLLNAFLKFHTVLFLNTYIPTVNLFFNTSKNLILAMEANIDKN